MEIRVIYQHNQRMYLEYASKKGQMILDELELACKAVGLLPSHLPEQGTRRNRLTMRGLAD